MNKNQTNRLLGYPPDARLLILNADDFGMCHSVNEAIIQVLKAGLVRSTSLMIPCPWALHAKHFLKDHAEIPFGIHLTAISDFVDYAWGPVTPTEKVPSLVTRTGHFYPFDRMAEFLAQVPFDQLEMEFRAQIQAVLAAGLHPTHLDWHSLRIGARADIFDLLLGLAREYHLALRMSGQPAIDKVQSGGLPSADYVFLDSYGLDPANKTAQYTRMLRELPAGLSEWAVHPGLDDAELLAIEPTGRHERQTDFDFWTSQQTQEIMKQEGIILLDYRPLQAVWNGIPYGM